MEKNLVFEIYGGAGASIQHHEYSSYDFYQYEQYNGSADLSFVKLFIQPSLGVKTDFFEIAVSTRVCRLSYTDINKNLYGSSYMIEELNSMADKSHFFVEPALTLRGGGKNIKVQVQALYSGYLNSPRLYFGEELHLSAGLFITIPAKVKD
jgi:hypothetical protein